jgi:hypothetical protein
MTPSTTFARRAYAIAGIYGLIVLAPQYFMERIIGETSPPAITHPEYFYGFAGVALAWQFAFLLIARDPQRFRALMPVTWIEKLSFGIPAIVLFTQGRLSENMLGAGILDLVLGAFFVVAYFKTPPSAA